MPSITVLRDRLDLRDGTRKTYRVFFAKNKIRENVRRIFDVLISSQLLEGNDRIICKSGKRVTHDYLLCISCCKMAQLKPSSYCTKCLRKSAKSKPAVMPTVSAPNSQQVRDHNKMISEQIKKRLPVIQNSSPHPNAKYYKY